MDKRDMQKIVKKLNEALKLDRKAITILFSKRVECNDLLAKSFEFRTRCWGEEYEKTKKCDIGVLGLLNSLISNENIEGIYAVYNQFFEIERFILKSKGENENASSKK